MAQAISGLKKYYPGSYFDLIKPYRDPSVSNSFRLAVPQLKHGHYETFEEKLPWLIDVIGRTDPAILEDLKDALKEVVKPPSSKAKAKYDAWVELMEDDRFRRLLAMFGLLYYPTPEEAPPLEDIKRSMETTDYMLEQAKRGNLHTVHLQVQAKGPEHQGEDPGQHPGRQVQDGGRSP